MAKDLTPQNQRFLRKLQSQQRPGAAIRPLTAAAAPIDFANKSEARKIRVLRQAWQQDAASYIDNIPELSFAYRFLAHASSRMRYFPAMVNPEEPDGHPVPVAEVPGVPPGVIDCMNQAMQALGVGRQALVPLQESMSWQFGGPGECYLVGMGDPSDGTETWKIHSIDEFMVFDDAYKIRDVPIDPQGTLGWTDLDPAKSYAARMWNPWWRYQKMATSPMRALLDVAEELLLLSRDVRSTARSRLTGGGILKWPEGLRMAAINPDNDDPEAEDVFGRFSEAIQLPLADEGVASAVVPIVISGTADELKALDHMLIDRPFSALAMQLRAEAIGRIATGLDIPREVIEGMSDPNHWGAWLVSDDTFRHHIEPQVITQVDAMSAAYMRVWLTAAGIPKYWVDRACIWYDPAELISKPDPMANAILLHDRYTISDEALREAGGYDETAKPGPDEIEFRMLQKTRMFPPNMVEAIFHKIDPSLKFPAVTTPGTIPGIGPTGEVEALPPAPAPPAAPSSGVPPVASSPTGPGSSAPAPAGMAEAATSFTSDPSEPIEAQLVFQRESRQLGSLDRELRARLQTAATHTMNRLLERSGAKLRTKLGDRKVNKDQALKTAMTPIPNIHLAAALGQPLVASLGFASAHDLIAPDWSELKAQFYGWTEVAQKQALGIATKIAGIDIASREAQTALDTMKDALDPAWASLEAELTSRADHLLFTPDTEGDAIDPISTVPTGIIRRALAIAGGTPAHQAVTAANDPIDVATPPNMVSNPSPGSISVTVGDGQIGTGKALTDLIEGSGNAEAISHEWQHGPSMRPFDGHLDLDGVTFTAFDDQVLANPDEWPTNDFFFPGDHDGCSCDFTTVWGSAQNTGDDGGTAGSDDAAPADAASSWSDLGDLLRSSTPDLRLELAEHSDYVSLDQIILPEAGRGQGTGTAVMTEITNYADRTGTTLGLTPSADYGGTVTRLRSFYKGFGFVPNTGRKADLAVSDSMIRTPR